MSAATIPRAAAPRSRMILDEKAAPVTPRRHLLARIGLPETRTDRSMLYARGSIVTNLAMAAWKIALGVGSLSLLLVITGIVNLGAATGKAAAIRQHGAPASPDGAKSSVAVFRRLGAMIAGVGLLYVVATLVPVVRDRVDHFEAPVAIAITALAFLELAIAIPGVVTARRQSILMLEAVRLLNLTAALALVPLAQTSLLSLHLPRGAGSYEGVVGAIFGAGIGLIGVAMVTSRRWRSTRSRARRRRIASESVR